MVLFSTRLSFPLVERKISTAEGHALFKKRRWLSPRIPETISLRCRQPKRPHGTSSATAVGVRKHVFYRVLLVLVKRHQYRRFLHVERRTCIPQRERTSRTCTPHKMHTQWLRTYGGTPGRSPPGDSPPSRSLTLPILRRAPARAGTPSVPRRRRWFPLRRRRKRRSSCSPLPWPRSCRPARSASPPAPTAGRGPEEGEGWGVSGVRVIDCPINTLTASNNDHDNNTDNTSKVSPLRSSADTPARPPTGSSPRQGR